MSVQTYGGQKCLFEEMLHDEIKEKIFCFSNIKTLNYISTTSKSWNTCSTKAREEHVKSTVRVWDEFMSLGIQPRFYPVGTFDEIAKEIYKITDNPTKLKEKVLVLKNLLAFFIRSLNTKRSIELIPKFVNLPGSTFFYKLFASKEWVFDRHSLHFEGKLTKDDLARKELLQSWKNKIYPPIFIID